MYLIKWELANISRSEIRLHFGFLAVEGKLITISTSANERSKGEEEEGKGRGRERKRKEKGGKGNWK